MDVATSDFELLKHCIRSRYDHCKGKTIKNITDSFTDYLKYHKTSYSIYETLEYRKQSENMPHGNMFPLFLHSELAKYISVGNYVRIGKVFSYFSNGSGFQMNISNISEVFSRHQFWRLLSQWLQQSFWSWLCSNFWRSRNYERSTKRIWLAFGLFWTRQIWTWMDFQSKKGLSLRVIPSQLLSWSKVSFWNFS